MSKWILMPDSFKGTMSSLEICQLMREALLRHVPDAEVVSIPVADGGEGSVEAFLAAMGGHRVEVPCTGPDFRKISGFYGLLADGYTAVIEMAAAALGVRFLDGTGAEYVPVGGTLDRLCRIDMSHRFPLLNGVEIVTMCDVDNPLCGPNGASAVFGPQKGADPDMVTRLDRNLRHLSEVIRQDLGREIADLPGAGAAGGMGAGVMAFLGSRLQMGIETVLDTVGFDALLPGATAVLTGEGRIDCQSLRGKVVIGIAHRARQTRIPVVAVVGDVAPGAEDAYQEGVTAIVSTNRRAVPWEVARQSARADLCAALEDLFRLYNAFRSAR